MMSIQGNSKCLKSCKIPIYPLDKVEGSSTRAISNDSRCCCRTSIFYKRFLSAALSSQISDHRTSLDSGIDLPQHKRQVSTCLPCQTCSYILASSRLCLSDCRTIPMCKLQFSSISTLGNCTPSSCKPLRISHSRRTSSVQR